jgi:hypothetical protein
MTERGAVHEELLGLLDYLDDVKAETRMDSREQGAFELAQSHVEYQVVDLLATCACEGDPSPERYEPAGWACAECEAYLGDVLTWDGVRDDEDDDATGHERRRGELIMLAEELERSTGVENLADELDRLWRHPEAFENGDAFRDSDLEGAIHPLVYLSISFGAAYERKYPADGEWRDDEVDA